MFKSGDIEGVVARDLRKYADPRGWLVEFFREDEIAAAAMPVMGYVSMTLPGVARGPHEHREQSDYFAFVGPSTFKIYLWDSRKNSSTAMHRMVLLAGEDQARSLIIPPGVVHAYKNVGGKPGLVVNVPNRLFAGPGKKEIVDEIRHEDIADSPFVMD